MSAFDIRLVIVGLLALLAPLTVAPAARADNLTLGEAFSFMVGGTPAEGAFSGTGTERWYITSLQAGRSYCVETQGGVLLDTSATAGRIDTVLAVFRLTVANLIGSNDDVTSIEPGARHLSRVCFIAPNTDLYYIRVKPFNDAAQFNFRVRIVETTLFSNWFFLGGDYNAYTIIRNTTSLAVSLTVRWRSLSGTVLKALTMSIPGNGGAYLNARDQVPSPATNQTGNVEIAHTASPQAIMATETILSSATGLSFDTVFTQRQPW